MWVILSSVGEARAVSRERGGVAGLPDEHGHEVSAQRHQDCTCCYWRLELQPYGVPQHFPCSGELSHRAVVEDFSIASRLHLKLRAL